MEVDEIGIDEIGEYEMGRRRSGMTTFSYLNGVNLIISHFGSD